MDAAPTSDAPNAANDEVDQLDAPDTAVAAQDAQWLAGVTRMAGTNARSATEAAAVARAERAMTAEQRLEKRRADQLARRQQQRDAARSRSPQPDQAEGAADMSAEDREAERKARRAATKREKYAQEQLARQRRLRWEQHQRELPARQAYLEDMREMIMEEMSETSGGESDQTVYANFSQEREVVLFEAKWSDYEHIYLGFNKERAEPFASLATLAQEQRQWVDELGWHAPLNYPKEDDDSKSDNFDDLPDPDVGISCGWQVPLRQASLVELAQVCAALHRLHPSRRAARARHSLRTSHASQEWAEEIKHSIIYSMNQEMWTKEEIEHEGAAHAERERIQSEISLSDEMIDRQLVEWPSARELEQEAPADEEDVWGHGSADCFYYRPTWDDEPSAFHAHPGEDEGSTYDRWCDYALETMARPERRARSISCGAGASSSQSQGHAIPVAETRHERAQIAGRPPRRAEFGSDQQFRSARSQWYQTYTGEPLEPDGSLAEQQRVFDAVARAWRAYSDGRRSLSATQWDGRLTPAERRINML